MVMYLGLLMNNIIGSFIDYRGVKCVVGEKKDKFGRIFWWVLTAWFLLMGIFRHPDLGFDGDSYYNDYYRVVNHLSLFQLMHMRDPLFYLIIKSITLILDDYAYVRMVLYVCTFLPCSIYIYKNSNNICFSYSVYVAANYLGFTYGILRQSLAVSICLLAWVLAKKKKWTGSVVLIILASLIHTTAAFFILPFMVINITEEKKRHRIEGLILLLMIIFSQNILGWLSDHYLYGRYSTLDETGHGGFQILAYVMMSGISFAVMYFIDKGSDTTWFELLLWILAIQVLAYQVSIFGRMNSYLWIIFAVEYTKAGLRRKYEIILAVIIITILSSIYLYILWTDEGIMIPYRTIFNA